MGLLVKELQRVGIMYLKTPGNYETLFITKGSAKRIDDLDSAEFGPKSAVVVCGISGIGKTTFINEFVSKHPNFKVCSMDEAYYNIALKSGGDIPNNGDLAIMIEFEKDFRNKTRHGSNVILDGTFVAPHVRATVLNALHTIGYTTYVLYYSNQTMMEMFYKCCRSRATGMVLTLDYIHKKSEEGDLITFAKNLEISKHIFEILEKETGKTREEYVQSMYMDRNVLDYISYLQDLADQEKARQRYGDQIKKNAFWLGTDYYFEL